jgi:hypothetical protein
MIIQVAGDGWSNFRGGSVPDITRESAKRNLIRLNFFWNAEGKMAINKAMLSSDLFD